MLDSEPPRFLCRLGGSDTNALAALLTDQMQQTPDSRKQLEYHRGMVQKFNGYYDLAQDWDKFVRYLDVLMACYKGAKYLSFCGFQLLQIYFQEDVPEAERKEKVFGRAEIERLTAAIDAAGQNPVCVPYGFIEKITRHHYSLFHLLAKVLPGKRVLVVSPFAESIELNFANRMQFFKDFAYPDFTLLTTNTPVTYSGLPPSYYPHADWFETTEALIADVSAQDFDIALLSCGSYALPIGHHIEHVLKRRAIYVGGVLQLFFGIMGRRYQNKFFTDPINEDAFIFPVEGPRLLQHVDISPETRREAFGAYF